MNGLTNGAASSKSHGELARLSVLYALLSQINRIIVRTDHSQALFDACCRAAVDYGGFSLAWVGLLEPGTGYIVPVAIAGTLPPDRLEFATRSRQLDCDQCPAVHAVREQRPCIVNDALSDPRCALWQEISLAQDLQAIAAFPLSRDNTLVGVLTVAAAQPQFFAEDEASLLGEVADDISFALGAIQREAQRVIAESQIRFLTHYDEQTGLPGKIQFFENFKALCEQSNGGRIAALVVNLRRYHGVLQALGQSAAVDIARAIAQRIETYLPDVPMGRVSESKFALALPDPGGLSLIEEAAWELRNRIAEPIHVAGQQAFLDPFVGIAVFPLNGSAEAVCEGAHIAAETSIDDSSCCRFYSAEMESGTRRQLEMDTALRQALKRGEFQLHYQPQVDLATGQIIGAEALLRWHWPGHGPISPVHFIPLLEANGCINAVGDWALHEACRQVRAWQEAGLPPVRVAVNLSARQFRDGDILSTVRKVLDQSQLDPQWLELELTESIVLLDADMVIRTMHDLNANGVTHALDDFGTGYSSLSYLQRLPVARIKIDRAFVTDITSNPANAAIARAILGMAHSLKLTVIAEGIETQGQLDFLRKLGCDEIQGYYFSRPLRPDDFVALLREGRQLPVTNSAGTERILLIVDDEPSMLSALKRSLRHCNFRILATGDPNQAFELLASHAVGVVLCDQRMPDMTGTEFLRRVKELHPQVVRIILSGFTELNSVIDAVNRGAIFRFLTKPLENDVLVANIMEAFSLFEMEQENRRLNGQVKALLALAQNEGHA